MNEKSQTGLLLLGVVALSLCLRAPLALERIRRTPDSICYCNIAANLAAGRGFTSNILLHSRDASVAHSSASEWPPLYPMVAAGLMTLGGDELTLQFANAVLVSIAAGLVFLTAHRLFGLRVGLLAGVAAAVAPNVFRAAVSPLSDALGLALALLAVYLSLGQSDDWRIDSLTGLATALATVTRYPYAVLLVQALVMASGRQRVLRIGTCLAVIVPVEVWQWASSGGLHQAQALHYCVWSYHRALWSAHTPIDHFYALHHSSEVMGRAASNAVSYGSDLLAGPRGLCLLGVGLLRLWTRRSALDPRHRLVLTLAALNFLIYAATWSIPPVRGSRFMLLSYCLLLPFCAKGMLALLEDRRRMLRLAGGLACAVTAAFYLSGTIATARRTAGEEPKLDRVTAQAILADLPAGTNLASNNPWAVAQSTKAPTALLPRDLDECDLASFTNRLRIGEIVLLGKTGRCATIRSIERDCRTHRISGEALIVRPTARKRTMARGR